MQICNSEIPIQESIKCYRQALECDPTFASAYESLGWALDSYFSDFKNARRNFELAIENGAGDSARIGLARVLAQMGETVIANQSLAECDDKTRALIGLTCRERFAKASGTLGTTRRRKQSDGPKRGIGRFLMVDLLAPARSSGAFWH